MNKITIYRYYFTNSDCYKSNNKEVQPKGIQVHSTGANNPYLKRYVGPDDGRLGKNQYNNYHNRAGLTVCANAYIGKLEDGTAAIYQTLPWEYKCWLSGSASKGNANKLGYIGFEICEDNKKNKEYFEEVVMGLSVKLVAYLCKKFNIPLDMIHDHNELHEMGLASNHGDIKHWLELYGVTMNDYRAEVKKAMDEGVQVTYIEESKVWTDGDEPQENEEIKPLCTAITTADNNYPIKMRETPSANSTIVCKVPLKTKVNIIEIVNDEWDKVEYNGIIGYMMSKFLIIEDSTLISIKKKLEQVLQLVEEMIQELDSKNISY